MCCLYALLIFHQCIKLHKVIKKYYSGLYYSEQVKNDMKHKRNASRLTLDALFNLHKFAHDYDFVKHITTLPDLGAIVEIFRSLLSSSSSTNNPMQQLTYDTTFNLGDFYLSVLVFRESVLQQP